MSTSTKSPQWITDYSSLKFNKMVGKKHRDRVTSFKFELVREVIEHMSKHNLAEIEFNTRFKIEVEEDGYMVPVIGVALNAMGEVYLDNGSSIYITKIHLMELAYILDVLEDKLYKVNEFETVPDK